jgi:PmbA protein
MLDPHIILSRATAHGADAADVVLTESVGTSVSWRLGKAENVERSESRDLGLRVFVGQQAAIVSTSDLSETGIAAAVSRAVDMARAVPADPFARLARTDELAAHVPDLDLDDGVEPLPEVLLAACRQAEEAALAVPGVTNSEGAEASWERTVVHLATSHGFARSYASSDCGVSVSVLAGTGLAMEREDDFTAASHWADLESPDAVGRRAGEGAIKRLSPRRVRTGQYPVILDPRVGGGLLRSFASAINGASVARGTTFLKESLGQRVFAPGITVVDDPLIRRGHRSRPFDAEGLSGQALTLVDDGILKTWLLDLATAGRLGLVSNGRASRGVSSPPSPSASNLAILPGTLSPAALMSDIRSGFYVTETMGMGINLITGDFSQGAAGFWIENGQLAFPVSEVTIAGRLQDMFADLAAADDLVRRTGVDTPTLRLARMTVAGE